MNNLSVTQDEAITLYHALDLLIESSTYFSYRELNNDRMLLKRLLELTKQKPSADDEVIDEDDI